MVTHTHTVLWSEKELATLRKEADRLEDDFKDREPFIDAHNRDRMKMRLVALRAAISFLADRAD